MRVCVCVCSQIVGQVAGDDPTKVSKALTHMRTAIVRTEEDPDVRELLAEMCATAGDHAGKDARTLARQEIAQVHFHTGYWGHNSRQGEFT